MDKTAQNPQNTTMPLPPLEPQQVLSQPQAAALQPTNGTPLNGAAQPISAQQSPTDIAASTEMPINQLPPEMLNSQTPIQQMGTAPQQQPITSVQPDAAQSQQSYSLAPMTPAQALSDTESSSLAPAQPSRSSPAPAAADPTLLQKTQVIQELPPDTYSQPISQQQPQTVVQPVTPTIEPAPTSSDQTGVQSMPTAAPAAQPATQPINRPVLQPASTQTAQPASEQTQTSQLSSAPTAQLGTQEAVSNGDNSKVSGDTPIQNPDSIQIVQQKEAETADKVKKVASAETAHITPSQSASSASTSSEGSYDQIRRLGEKVEQSAAPDDFKQVLSDRVARLALIRSGAGFTSSTYILEYESTSRYINWVVGLPWDKKSEDVLDLAKAKEILDKNHYGLEPLKERVLQYIASIMLNIKNNGPDYISHSPILCFVGLAGTGKTTFAKSVAEALGRQFERIPFGGLADSRFLRGQSRYFPDAEPGAIIKRLVHAGAKNPVILLDELDRVTESARSDIMGVLIELLDPEQNFAFADHYIDYPFNLSSTLFIATANNTTAISTAVLDRLEIIQMPSYTDEEKTVIGKNYVFPREREMTGLKENQLTIADDVWASIIRPLGFDSGIRSLERTIGGMCRKAAEIIVEGQAQSVQINLSNIKQFIPQW